MGVAARETVELLDESPLGGSRLLVLPSGVERGPVSCWGGWCVGMLLGPETTPAMVLVLEEKCSGAHSDSNRSTFVG